MTRDESCDEMLGNLTMLRPDSARADQLRARCRAELERRRRRSQRRSGIAAAARNLVAPVFVTGLTALCLADLVESVVATRALTQ
jgi:hypothetical protein